MKYDVIIIGAGPAGLFAGLSIENKKVLILEKNNLAGRKLIISGAGQCNYTNSCSIDEFLKKYNEKEKFIKPSIYNLTNDDIIEFFKNCNVESIIRDDKKVFPKSLKSNDILEALLKKCKENNVDILYNEDVKKVNYMSLEKKFSIETSKDVYCSDSLIISTGGKSYMNTGSTGDGYVFSKKLGHNITRIKQSLSPVYVYGYKFRDLSGISFKNISLSLWRKNKKVNQFEGDLLFTHTNLSGPIIINNSRYMEIDDVIKINYISHIGNSDEAQKYLENEILYSKNSLKSVLTSLNIPKRFIDKVLDMSNIDINISSGNLKKEDRKILIKLLCCQEFVVEKLGGYNTSMSTCGGVDTKEVSSKTMESKLIKNLYFAGEILDIDAQTGGFNIHGAMAMGKLAAKSINGNKN